jgi:hypothetical protein
MNMTSGSDAPTLTYTAKAYCETFTPGIIDLMNDPEACYRELTQEATELASLVGLGADPEGRYALGLWSLLMAGPLPHC